MKILYLAHRIPYPPNKGDKIRSYHQVRFLAERHDVDLGCLCDDVEDLQHGKALEKLCRSVCVVPRHTGKRRARSLLRMGWRRPLSVAYFYDERLQDDVNRRLRRGRYDAVVCFSSCMAEYVFRSPLGRLLGKAGDTPRTVMDFCDVDSDKWAQYATESPFPWNVFYRWESKRLAAYERTVHACFDVSVVISRREADLFCKTLKTLRRPHVVGNGVDVNYFAMENGPNFSMEREPVVVFVGAMNYHANVDGVLWFCREVWPRVRAAVPSAEFRIVGSRPAPKVRALHGKSGIYVTGFVPDVRPYLAQAWCSVAPLRLARGVQNKVLEAMAMGKAVVATPQALEGLEVRPGHEVLCAQDPLAYAKLVIQILKNEALRRGLEKNAREYVHAHHSWARELQKFEAWIFERKGALDRG
ncbi:TIGR03087 family PEP-CTERM/XrtA system glycosyltransferase [Desulfosoma sp.]|uniref:TIGR03087 family PEP-CTERM/XrtA system glycosyltransferase n=1 Tax=Desulfosoma sp. TaxID=2603217 RepID=UPI00404AD675